MESRGVKKILLTLSKGELGVAINGDVIVIVAHDKLA